MCRRGDVRMGDRADVRRAVYRAVRADDYRAFLVYQCCMLAELLQSFCKACAELRAEIRAELNASFVRSFVRSFVLSQLTQTLGEKIHLTLLSQSATGAA